MATSPPEESDGEATDDALVDAGRLEKLSIAPDSDEPSATREKVLTWAVASGNGRIAVALSALNEREDMYTAIAKGWLSKQEARELRDSLDEALVGSGEERTFRIYECIDCGKTSMPVDEKWRVCPDCDGELSVLEDIEASDKGEAYDGLKEVDGW